MTWFLIICGAFIVGAIVVIVLEIEHPHEDDPRSHWAPFSRREDIGFPMTRRYDRERRRYFRGLDRTYKRYHK